MKIQQVADLAAQHARRNKESSVRATKHGPVITATLITCFRGDEPVALIGLPPNRDEMLKIAALAASGFSADVLTITFDTYMTTGEETAAIDPRTWKRWAPNAMQSYAEEVELDDGLIMEAIVTTVWNRAGDSIQIRQPYRVDGKDVTWLDDPVPAESNITGTVPTALAAIMSAQTADHALATIAPEWARKMYATDPVRSRWHMDMATVTVIEEQAGHDVMVGVFAKPGSVQHQMYRERLARSQVFNPSDLN